MTILGLIQQSGASGVIDTMATAINDTVATATTNAAAGTVIKEELSVWDLCLKGGWIMIPLLILSVVSIYIFIERFIALRAAAKRDDSFMKRIKDYIHDGEIESAMNLCKKTNTPMLASSSRVSAASAAQ